MGCNVQAVGAICCMQLLHIFIIDLSNSLLKLLEVAGLGGFKQLVFLFF